MAAVAAVLSTFDFDLIREVTDPRTGIMTTEKFMTFPPNAGELKVYCETLAARKDRLQRLGARRPAAPADRLLAAPEPIPGDLASVFVPTDHKRYPELVAWSKRATSGDDMRKWRFGKAGDGRAGIWVAFDIWDDRRVITGRGLADIVKSITEAAE